MGFGNFQDLCENVPLPLCTLLNSKDGGNTFFKGILPKCYARSVILENTLIFEIGTAFINIGNLLILLRIIYLVRQRYTAVARKEMIFFFWSLVVHTIISLIIDTGVSPPGSPTYAYFVSFEIANMAVVCWSLLFAGLSSMNFWDDGSFKTMFSLYFSSFVVFAVNYIIAILTFKGWAPYLDPSNTTVLYVFYFILNSVMLGMWFISQIIICCFTLVFNWWALGALSLACCFFAVAQVSLLALSNLICTSMNHYVDGTIFSSLSMMFCYMMIYEYWDIITFDDDEYYRYTEFVPAIANKEEAIQLLQK